ncbi:hypothetical protein H5410_034485 [Solanum commersonii]|uniref:Uncharacterized protein n=1 Tax=Solanum commersonii TaxID=4109 RepID=A0A9J5YQS5_SOLCO|nr:hypothetical protein H5410_034485 [Solanum commersonii]
MDMKSIKDLLEQMLDQVQHQHTGESKDVYEIIGKLEQIKSYLLTQAMRSNVFSALSFLHSPPPQQPSPPIADQQALVSHQQTTPLIAGQQVMTQAVDNVGQPTPMVVQNPQPAGPFSMPPVHWQVVDENLFNAVDEPVLWFSKLVTSQQMLTVPSDKKIQYFEKGSPPSSYVHSPLFPGMTLPVTLHSSKLESMIGGVPGLLYSKSKKAMHIYWPSVGKYFKESTMIDVWFQWKKLGPKYMLIVKVEEQGAGTGASGAGTGASGAGAEPSGAGAEPSGAGAEPSGAGASKRPKLGGV